MKDKEILILVFVVLVIAVVMMKSTKKDTKPTPDPPKIFTDPEELLDQMEPNQYAYGTVKQTLVNENYDELLVPGNQCRITKAEIYTDSGLQLAYAVTDQTQNYAALSLADRRLYSATLMTVSDVLANVEIDLTSGIMGP